MKAGSKYKFEVGLFKYLWGFAILPKELQFFVFLFIAARLINRQPLRRDRASTFFILGIAIQIAAIIWQCIFNRSAIDANRLFAAFNTTLIWVIAIYLYRFFLTADNVPDLACIGKYMAINLVILSILCIASRLVPFNTVTILRQTYALKRMDYLSSGTTTRFCGLLETVLGPSHLFCLAFPTALIYVKKWKLFPVQVLFCLFTYWPIWESHSRIGVVVCGVILLMGLVYLLLSASRLNAKSVLSLIMLVLLAVGLYAILNYQDLYIMFRDLFHSRAGSNNARFSIYKNSISYALENSPLIGIGIKYMLGNFPYGSHCTYIGIFYKTGIIGSILFGMGFLCLVKLLLRLGKHSFPNMLMTGMYLCYFGMLVFSDLDGTNWVIVLWFALWGTLGRIRRPSNEKTENCLV